MDLDKGTILDPSLFSPPSKEIYRWLGAMDANHNTT